MIFFLVTEGDGVFADTPEALICPHCQKAAILLPMVVVEESAVSGAASIKCPSCSEAVLNEEEFVETYTIVMNQRMENELRHTLALCPVNPDCPQKKEPVKNVPDATSNILVHKAVIADSSSFPGVSWTLEHVRHRCLRGDCQKAHVTLPLFLLEARLLELQPMICPVCGSGIATEGKLKEYYVPAEVRHIKDYLTRVLNDQVALDSTTTMLGESPDWEELLSAIVS